MSKKSIDLKDFQSYPKVIEVETTSSKVIDTVDKKNEIADPCAVASKTVHKEKKSPIPSCLIKPKEDISETPPPPKSYIDFFLAWKKINHSPKQRFLYLKQTPGGELSKIFKESLESTTLSELIETLETGFLPSKEPVYPYLLGMSKVERLSTLTLFMSGVDKARMKLLVENCECLGECSKEEGIMLRQKYEL